LTQCDYVSTVMAGLVPAIHVFAAKEGVDGRDKRGHDDCWFDPRGRASRRKAAVVATA
jgi:hypothetical protein